MSSMVKHAIIRLALGQHEAFWIGRQSNCLLIDIFLLILEGRQERYFLVFRDLGRYLYCWLWLSRLESLSHRCQLTFILDEIHREWRIARLLVSFICSLFYLLSSKLVKNDTLLSFAIERVVRLGWWWARELINYRLAKLPFLAWIWLFHEAQLLGRFW